MTATQTAPRAPWYRGQFLLMVCLFAMAILPFGHSGQFGFVRSSVFSAVLLTAIYTISESRRFRVVGVVLGLPALVFTWLDKDAVGTLAAAAFLGYVIGHVVAKVMRTSTATAHTVWAGVCAYLLIPVFWTQLYALCIFANGSPHAVFRGISDDPAAGDWMTQVSYYSFVTVTTLGFGDISPVSQLARRLTTAEAIVGQLFVAIFIARLVGLHLAAQMARRDTQP